MNRGLLVALAIVMAAAGGFFVQRQLQATKATAAAPPEATDAGAEAIASEVPEQKIPEVLPDITIEDRDGKPRSIKEWAGKPLMVNFWATWCGPCRKEIPLLHALRKQHSDRNLEVLGLAIDFREDVLEYTKSNPISYPVLIADEDGFDVLDAFGIGGGGALPVTIFADSRQRIVAVRVGELHDDQADLILGRLLAVDAGKLDIQDAKTEIMEGMKEIAIRRAAAEAEKGA